MLVAVIFFFRVRHNALIKKMGDAFNPQEILSRLRAKPNSGAAGGGNGSIGSVGPNSTPIVTIPSNNGSNKENGKGQKGAIKTPASLTLTATQVRYLRAIAVLFLFDLSLFLYLSPIFLST